MKTTTVMFTLFLAAFGLCMTASALPHGEPVGLRAYTHNIYIYKVKRHYVCGRIITVN